MRVKQSKKSSKRKRKSTSKSVKKKKKIASTSSSFKHSKKSSNVFSQDVIDNKTFSLFNSSLKNSMFQNEENTLRPEDIHQGLISLKNSGVFRKKSKPQRKIKEKLISQSATRKFQLEQSPVRLKKKGQARDHSLKKSNQTKMMRSSVQLKPLKKSSKRSVSKSLKKQKKKSLLIDRKIKKNMDREKSNDRFKKTLDLKSTTPKFRKFKTKSKRIKLKKQNTLQQNVNSLLKKNDRAIKMARLSQTRVKNNSIKNPDNELLIDETFQLSSFETSERSIKANESIQRVSQKPRRSSQFELPVSEEVKGFENLKKRKSLIETRKVYLEKPVKKKTRINHKKTQSQIDLRKLKGNQKKSKMPATSKSPNKKRKIVLPSKFYKTETMNKFESNKKLNKNSLHKLLYKKLKNTNMTPKSKKILNNSERLGSSNMYLPESNNNTFSSGVQMKKFFTHKNEFKKKKGKVNLRINDGQKGYKNLYQMKKEGHARLRKATQKQFAKYFGAGKE
jgi:hypothetical protein